MEAVIDTNDTNSAEMKFDHFECVNKLVETGSGCQGSAIPVPAQGNGQKNDPKWLLFTHPSDMSRKIHLEIIEKFLKKSPQDTNAWNKPCIINKGLRAYSDLLMVGSSVTVSQKAFCLQQMNI